MLPSRSRLIFISCALTLAVLTTFACWCLVEGQRAERQAAAIRHALQQTRQAAAAEQQRTVADQQAREVRRVAEQIANEAAQQVGAQRREEETARWRAQQEEYRQRLQEEQAAREAAWAAAETQAAAQRQYQVRCAAWAQATSQLTIGMSATEIANRLGEPQDYQKHRTPRGDSETWYYGLPNGKDLQVSFDEHGYVESYNTW